MMCLPNLLSTYLKRNCVIFQIVILEISVTIFGGLCYHEKVLDF